MAGTLTISTLSDGTNSTSSTNCIQGSAKAWANFNGSGGAIRGSYNISSITVNGTGNYTANFTTAMANANYSTVIQVRFGSAAVAFLSGNIYSDATYTTSSVQFLTGQINTLYDCPVVCIAVFSS